MAVASPAGLPGVPPTLGLGRNAAGLAAGRVAAALVSLASVMILARVLSIADYGVYQQLWLFYATALPLLTAGLPSSVSFLLPRQDPSGQKLVALQSIALMAGLGLLAAIAMAATAPWVAAGLGEPRLLRLLLLFAPYCIFAFPTILADSILVTMRRSGHAAAFNVFASIAQSAAVVIPAALGEDIATIALWLNASAVARLGLMLWLVFRGLRGAPLARTRGLLREQVRYALPLSASSAIAGLALQVDRILIAIFFSAATYAIYVNGTVEIPFVGIITGSLVTVLLPEFVRLLDAGRTTHVLQLWHSATIRVSMLIFPMACWLFFFAHSAVTVLFSSKYLDSVTVFQIMLLIMPLRVTQYSAVLAAAGKTTSVLKAAVGTLAVKLVLGLALVPTLGLAGAAWSTVAAVYVMALWHLASTRAVLHAPWGSIFPWRHATGLMLLAASAAFVAYSLTMPLADGFLRLLLGAAIVGALCLVAYLAHADTRRHVQAIVATVNPWTKAVV